LMGRISYTNSEASSNLFVAIRALLINIPHDCVTALFALLASAVLA